MYTSGSLYSSKRLSHLSVIVIILVCLGNTKKIRLQGKLLQLCYGGYYDTKKHFTLQFQYFWDFNKCLREIFSQLNFKTFLLYLLNEVAMTQNCERCLKIIISHLLKSV